jgi:hypothetical protein
MGYWSDYRKHGVWGGSEIADHLNLIKDTKAALTAVGICIDPYIDTTKAGTYHGITEVTGNPQPTGFKFFCKDTNGLKYRIKQLQDQLKKDDPTTAAGKFNSLKSTGDSFRESGLGRRLHIEVAPITDCHLDSHQIVAGSAPGVGTIYDFDSIAGHFTFDLAPELPILKWLYFPIGPNASFGPYFDMKFNRPDKQLHDPNRPDSGGLEFGAGFSIRGTFGRK